MHQFTVASTLRLMGNTLRLHPMMAIYMFMQFMMKGQPTDEWAAVQYVIFSFLKTGVYVTVDWGYSLSNSNCNFCMYVHCSQSSVVVINWASHHCDHMWAEFQSISN